MQSDFAYDLLFIATSSNQYHTIANLNNYKYLFFIGPSTNDTEIEVELIVPIAFAKQYASIHKTWRSPTVNGGYMVIYTETINNSTNQIAVGFNNLSGVYCFGSKS